MLDHYQANNLNSHICGLACVMILQVKMKSIVVESSDIRKIGWVQTGDEVKHFIC